MKRPLKILIDLDGITVDSLPQWLERIYERTGVRARIEDITRWELEKCHPLNQLDPKDIFACLQEPGFVSGAPIWPGAQVAIQTLVNDGHQVYFVTARHGPTAIAETFEWFRTHMPWVGERNLIFCYDKHLLSADVLIDDRAETLIKYGQLHPGALRLGILYPYNQHLLPDVELVPRNWTAWPLLYDRISAFAKDC